MAAAHLDQKTTIVNKGAGVEGFLSRRESHWKPQKQSDQMSLTEKPNFF